MTAMMHGVSATTPRYSLHGSGAVVEVIRAADGLNGREAPGGLYKRQEVNRGEIDERSTTMEDAFISRWVGY
eukprot:CAMPEP_0203961214 /NCGR_PEP_ID=MMETSP0359-20131031/91721_1 /ASSEMBLY_ACC=CAM_ASM_000338 /TAXON_ID=268821 /ORGANISM="Scrippsiella Hangoei, Strain SHTV-5" /LENGTH=71 /DNA_ID=CAMNT_0050895943 /DNA_START=220 /DNA_END=433 /DNA_ORIENTATION=+